MCYLWCVCGKVVKIRFVIFYNICNFMFLNIVFVVLKINYKLLRCLLKEVFKF